VEFSGSRVGTGVLADLSLDLLDFRDLAEGAVVVVAVGVGDVGKRRFECIRRPATGGLTSTEGAVLLAGTGGVTTHRARYNCRDEEENGG